MREVELLPTRDCEAGYGPDNGSSSAPAFLPRFLKSQGLTLLIIGASPSLASIDRYTIGTFTLLSFSQTVLSISNNHFVSNFVAKNTFNM